MPHINEVIVKSQKGKCGFGHKVGDKIVFDGRSVQGNICYAALMAVLPRIYAMSHGVEFSWAEDKNVIPTACPNADNPVVFEIRRIRK